MVVAVTMGALILTLAELVRAEAEAWAVEQSYCGETLTMLCPSVSAGCAAAMRAAGLDAEVAMGHHAVAEGHFWALAAEPLGAPRRRETRRPELRLSARWQDARPWAATRATWVDLTATQFNGPRLVVLAPGDGGRADYELEEAGDFVLRDYTWDRDWPEILDFTVRAVAAVRRAGLAMAVELDEEAVA